MELEVLWGENQILIFFIGIFCILINESFNKKQKINSDFDKMIKKMLSGDK